jgi:hypothetical protein
VIASPDRDPWGRDLAGELHVLTFDSAVLRDNPLGDPASRPLLVYTPPGWPDGGPWDTGHQGNPTPGPNVHA